MQLTAIHRFQLPAALVTDAAMLGLDERLDAGFFRAFGLIDSLPLGRRASRPRRVDVRVPVRVRRVAVEALPFASFSSFFSSVCFPFVVMKCAVACRLSSFDASSRSCTVFKNAAACSSRHSSNMFAAFTLSATTMARHHGSKTMGTAAAPESAAMRLAPARIM